MFIIAGGGYYNASADAQGCGIPADLIVYSGPVGCDSGANEVWSFSILSNGYDEIAAYYGGHLMCANVKGNAVASGTQIIAWGCDSGSIPPDEQWRQPEHTPDSGIGVPNASYIVPSEGYSLTWNVKGGLASGHDIILYGQNSQEDDGWAFNTR